jgi:homoserine dehydrogenase
MQAVEIGLIGLGTVGSGVVQILRQQADLFSARHGVSLNLKRVATRHPERQRSVTLAPGQLTDDVDAVIRDPEIDIVIELIGGYEPARSYVLESLRHGKHVVTANKALLAQSGQEIFQAAAASGLDIGFEASVGGGIPIIRAIREAYVANRFQSISSIINGTANYILSKMTDEARDFSDVLAEAQVLGYAEADPTYDVEGIDAAQKLALLTSLAFGGWISYQAIYTEGISKLTQLDIAYARELGYRVKLLALAKLDQGCLDVRVHPALVEATSWLAGINGVYNAVNIEGDMVGRQMLIGRGAGALPTASAVIADVVDVARRLSRGLRNGGPVLLASLHPGAGFPHKHIDDIVCCYYLRFQVLDQPGVLAAISGILGAHAISIASVIQKGRAYEEGGVVSLVLMTHEARERSTRQALQEIERLPPVQAESMCIRVEDPEED